MFYHGDVKFLISHSVTDGSERTHKYMHNANDQRDKQLLLRTMSDFYQFKMSRDKAVKVIKREQDEVKIGAT